MSRMTGKNCKNGFTVGELLIVVAIIAALVGISIPVIMKKVEKAREAYDIYTMRQAASAAIDLYYAGVHNAASATAAGMTWWNSETATNGNAAGAYNPKTGTFVARRENLPAGLKTYGKGTKLNAGTTLIMGNPRGAYVPSEDYTNACVMVSIYPNANPARVDVYWKVNTGGGAPYVGGSNGESVPKYSITIYLN